MARLQLNKSSLARETSNLAMYKRFLPSLDLKRQQLMAERAKAGRAYGETLDLIAALKRTVRDAVPMLANGDIDLTGLIQLEHVELASENVVGTRLPKVGEVRVRVRPYALLARPQWVDRTVALLREMIELRVKLQVNERRVELLDKAVTIITQRVNLFDKVLIPRTQANIKRIKIYLSDEEMAAVVRSKLAKKKNAQAVAS